MPINAAVAGILIALFAHAAASIWWASGISTTMRFLLSEIKELKEIEKNFEASRSGYSTKEEVALALAVADKELQAAWLIIDNLKERVAILEVQAV